MSLVLILLSVSGRLPNRSVVNQFLGSCGANKGVMCQFLSLVSKSLFSSIRGGCIGVFTLPLKKSRPQKYQSYVDFESGRCLVHLDISSPIRGDESTNGIFYTTFTILISQLFDYHIPSATILPYSGNSALLFSLRTLFPKFLSILPCHSNFILTTSQPSNP